VAIGPIWGEKLVGRHFGIGTQSGRTKVNNGLLIFTSQRTLKNEYTVIKDRSKLLTEQVNYALHCHLKVET